jgi:predicted DsbA family dithiol-disulfide isomerase
MTHKHTPDEERQIRDAALDQTVVASFPASDPPSSNPSPDDHSARDQRVGRRELNIDIYSDFVCPWCYLGTMRLEGVLSSLGTSLTVDVRHHPFLLHPDAPLEGVALAAELERQQDGTSENRVERVKTEAQRSGILLQLSAESRVYPTVAAHTLVRHARARGRHRTLVRELFETYFVESRNIADAGVLIDVASRHGFAAHETERLIADDQELNVTRLDAKSAVSRGIRGVPIFQFNGRVPLIGAQRSETFRRQITELASAGRP